MEIIDQHGFILFVVYRGLFQQLRKLSDQIDFANKRIATAQGVEAKPFGYLWHYPVEPRMTERSFLEYRLDVVRTMPDGAYKTALIKAISTKILSLRDTRRLVR